MNAQEWLHTNNKTPFSTEEYHYYYWGEVYPEENDPESEDMLLPKEIYDLLKGHKTYPSCRIYDTKQGALDDFEQAYNKFKGMI